MKIEINDEEKQIIEKLVAEKMKKTDWILQNKDADNPNLLAKRMTIYEGILNKLGVKE